MSGPQANPAEDQSNEEKLRFFHIRPIEGGSWAVCEPHEVLGIIDGDESYEIQRVSMTRSEFDALEDFDGW